MSEEDAKMEVDAAAAAAAAETQPQEEESEEFEVLEALEESNAKDAMAKYLEIVETPATAENQDELVKRKEKAVRRLSKLYAANNEVKALEALIINIRPTLDTMSKAKGGQIFRLLIDAYLSFANQTEAQVKMCLDCIEWAKNEKRNFLRQALEVKLQGLYYNAGQFQNCLQQIAPLLKELKRLDDKALLVDVQLIESKAFFALANYPKARASLVSARTTANGIYCPPKMQAALDLQSGVMHAQEGDFKTGYSYFYEAFEGFDSVDQKEQAILGLKYMLLSKIMLSEARDVPSIISGKLALRYTGRDLEAMQSIANASLHRSLKEFEQALLNFEKELKGDRIIVSHLDRLYDALLQQNLARIVEPFSRVEIEHVAAVIERPRAIVEAKLSQMILDKQLFGILDQGAGCLEVFDESSSDKTYEVSLETVQQMGTVVDALFKRAQKIV